MRARREVGVRFGGRKLRDTSGDTHLAVDLAPVKYQGGMGIRGQLLPLTAFVIGKEEEAALIDSLEQDHSRRWAAAGRSGRESHSVRFGEPGAFDGAEPAAELLNGV